MNYELMTANCKCDSSFMQGNLNNNTNNDNNNNEEKLSFKTLKESVLSNIFPFNIDVIYCCKLLLDFKKLKSNIGFIIMIILLLLQIIFLLIYVIQKLKSLKNFMLTFYKDQSTKKSVPPKNNNIKSKFAPNNNKIKPNIKYQKNAQEESNNENKINSKIKLRLMDADNSINSKQLISKEKLNKDQKFIVNNNFAPIINMQTPILNINDSQLITNKGIKGMIPKQINNKKIKTKRK